MTPGNLLHVPDVNGLSGAHAACSRKVSPPSEPGPPMTLGGAAAAQVRFIVWRKACEHQVEPDLADMAARYGARDRFSRLARAALLLAVRQPAGRYGGDRGKERECNAPAARYCSGAPSTPVAREWGRKSSSRGYCTR